MTRFGKVFENAEEAAMAAEVIQIVAEVAGYAVSEAVIRFEQGKSIRKAVELGVSEFAHQMIARLQQISGE